MADKWFYVLFLLIFICSLPSCTGKKKNGAMNQPHKETMDSSALAAIYNADFGLRCKPAESASNEPPREMHYMLLSDKLMKPVLITTEPSCNKISDNAAFDMPSETAFAGHGYYAGSGYYYYGLVQNDSLKIYRKWFEGIRPKNNTDPAETTYKLFKIILVYPDGSTTVNEVETN